ncbi:acylphosphatase [Tyzzerella sp. An114]|uniref:acylphosphatase n=1 Tax=Tyzzerella sp. An114 TaxID=1965545 RepID=UPI000B44E841|nr:acylphosphatase [Tyzzerella sp. An114]OUQ60581.1 acylphosphatase [Tyzzerella sp. An114]
MKRKHYFFYGRVQGVGFRYTMTYNARNLGLTGWVRNLYDGSVEAEVQGSEVRIMALIEKMQSNRFIRIDSMEVYDMTFVEGEKTFVEKW